MQKSGISIKLFTYLCKSMHSENYLDMIDHVYVKFCIKKHGVGMIMHNCANFFMLE